MKRAGAEALLASLTARETEVLQWLCECKTDAEIGEILGISVHTVSKHLQRVFKKLGVENRMAAARFAGPLLGRAEWTPAPVSHREGRVPQSTISTTPSTLKRP
jgi:DNA-binding CsgD family transcriptional regulator